MSFNCTLCRTETRTATAMLSHMEKHLANGDDVPEQVFLDLVVDMADEPTDGGVEV